MIDDPESAARLPRPDPRRRGHGFWEVTTASVVDWPCQGRIVELVDLGDGLLAISLTLHTPKGEPR